MNKQKDILHELNQLLRIFAKDKEFFKNYLLKLDDFDWKSLTLKDGRLLLFSFEILMTELDHLKKYDLKEYLEKNMLIISIFEFIKKVFNTRTNRNKIRRWGKKLEVLKNVNTLSKFIQKIKKHLVPSQILKLIQIIQSNSSKQICQLILEKYTQRENDLEINDLYNTNNFINLFEIIDESKLCFKMIVFYKSSSFERLQRNIDTNEIYLKNKKLLKLPTVYQRLRHLLFCESSPEEANEKKEELSKFVQFLFRHFLSFSNDPSFKMSSSLRNNVLLMIEDFHDLNTLAAMIIKETNNLNSLSKELLNVILSSRNPVLLQFLVDKFDPNTEGMLRMQTNRPRNTENMSNIRKLRNHLQGLVERYEQECVSLLNQDKVNESLFDLGLKIKTVLNKIIQNINSMKNKDLEHLLLFLVKQNTKASNNNVRNTVLNFLLSSLQEKLRFLENTNKQDLPYVLIELTNLNTLKVPIINKYLLRNPKQIAETNFKNILTNKHNLQKMDQLTSYYFFTFLIKNVTILPRISGSLRTNLQIFSSQNMHELIIPLLDDFNDSRDISIINPSTKYSGFIILLIINVVSVTLCSENKSFFLYQLYTDLKNSNTGRIPFNYLPFSFLNQFIQNLSTRGNRSIGTKMWKCKSCDFHFFVDNCGETMEEKQCSGCKRMIGGNNHRPNSNTVEVDLLNFRKEKLESRGYQIHEYLRDDTATIFSLSPFVFRIGHVLTHALYAGLALLKTVPVYGTLLDRIERNFGHLGIGSRNCFDYFYRHIECNMDWLMRDLRINERPFDFLFAILQDLLVQLRSGSDLLQFSTSNHQSIQNFYKNFENFVKPYKDNYRNIMKEVTKANNHKSEHAILNVDNIRGRMPFENIKHKMNDFLSICLRKITRIDLTVFKNKLEPEKQNYRFLYFYTCYIVNNTIILICRTSFRRVLQKSSTPCFQ